MSSAPESAPKHTNRLIYETSPYLRQHAHNPVDWYPWGEEALRRAREEDKPILLSIGYSACHWCHVMERESFENEQIAALMNQHFVNIKVDREERPDLDALYMGAVQAMTQHGGWPLTVFLTPDGVPFYGGTYFPPEPRHGMPGFPQVLLAVADAYRNRRGDVVAQAARVRKFLEQANRSLPGRQDLLQETLLSQATTAALRQLDPRYGGFGGAPKFPQPMTLEFLLRAWKRWSDPQPLHAVELTLEQMARGGIYDQLGGGFHRYSVDARWLVPHFEKMLYDNALLARLYLHAYQATGKVLYRRVAEETLDYVVREMTGPHGGFYSSQDADSEGVEGKFYLWTPEEVAAVLGERDARAFNALYDVTPQGNFEHRSILHLERPLDEVAAELGMAPAELEAVVAWARPKLYAAREQRVRPGRDEKVITAWNGLMLRAFAEAARVLERPDYRGLAVRNAEFVLGTLWQNGRLLRTFKDGQARIPAYLEDYALYSGGLLTLYEATFDPRWFRAARELADQMLALFWEPGDEAFYDTGHDQEQLVARPREVTDNAMPSGNSAAVETLLRLATFTGNAEYQRPAATVLRSLAEQLRQYPTAFGHLLEALDFYLSTPKEIVVLGPQPREDTQALLRTVFQRYLPNKVVAGADGPSSQVVVPLLDGREPLDGRATAFVCERFTCALPTSDPAVLASQLK